MASIMGKACYIRRIAVTNRRMTKIMIELGRQQNAFGQQCPHTGNAGHLLGFAHPTQPLISHFDSWIISCRHDSGQVEGLEPSQMHPRLSSLLTADGGIVSDVPR